MRNEAKYICCIGGFAGFLSFFAISLLLGEDALASVLRGSVGCLFCALCTRGILHLVLSSVSTSSNRVNGTDIVTPPSEPEQEDSAKMEPESVARKSVETATAEAVSDPPPTVAETVAA
ncbi:MAG: hypothetical protein CMI31_15525 [Opitutae bacterium]|nr:hypothetical protein [Opitutae bacterium]|tara:strand:- start:57 stop:413 length:357 start_codon:yes stop_codon:yes gene_type:complete